MVDNGHRHPHDGRSCGNPNRDEYSLPKAVHVHHTLRRLTILHRYRVEHRYPASKPSQLHYNQDDDRQHVHLLCPIYQHIQYPAFHYGRFQPVQHLFHLKVHVIEQNHLGKGKLHN